MSKISDNTLAAYNAYANCTCVVCSVLMFALIRDRYCERLYIYKHTEYTQTYV